MLLHSSILPWPLKGVFLSAAIAFHELDGPCPPRDFLEMFPSCKIRTMTDIQLQDFHGSAVLVKASTTSTIITGTTITTCNVGHSQLFETTSSTPTTVFKFKESMTI